MFCFVFFLAAISPNMDTHEPLHIRMDEEFDKYLNEMKPLVLNLTNKSERQLSAAWIKKLCDPVSGITARKNRNSYAKLMLQMLKKGLFEEPFINKPEDGFLPPLTAAQIAKFDQQIFRPSSYDFSLSSSKVPDWVTSELILNSDTSSNGTFTSSSRHHRKNCHSNNSNCASFSTTYEKSRKSWPAPCSGGKLPFTSSTPAKEHVTFNPVISSSSESISLGSSTNHSTMTTNENFSAKYYSDKRQLSGTNDIDIQGGSSMAWSKAISSMGTVLRPSSSEDDIKTGKCPAKYELERKTKLMEAQFYEEKLQLQQKHDKAVQKILDRKNAEIEELKTHFNSKRKNLEDMASKLDSEVKSLNMELYKTKESKDKQISELKKQLEDTYQVKKSEFEKKLHSVISELEQEKVDLQRQHSQNIQKMLDETNIRLEKMELAYKQQNDVNASVIKDLEFRVQELTIEADQITKARNSLEAEKKELMFNIDNLTDELDALKQRAYNLEEEHKKAKFHHSQQQKELQCKYETETSIAKQEHELTLAKMSDTVSDQEQCIKQLMQDIQDAENERQRQIKELEYKYEKDKVNLEVLHEKQIQALEKELSESQVKYLKSLQRLEAVIRDKDNEIKELINKSSEQCKRAEKAMEQFKSEVEKEQTKIYNDMRSQTESAEKEMRHAKQQHEKQIKEFNKKLEEVKRKYEKELHEAKMGSEEERSQLLREQHIQYDMTIREQQREKENLKLAWQMKVQDVENHVKEVKETSAKHVAELKQEVKKSQENAIQIEQKYKQQIIELGLKRDEEKQKLVREHENQVGKFQSQLEQHRLNLQKCHSEEMNKVLEKTSMELKNLETEYSERNKKANETISDLQSTIYQLREDMKKQRETLEQKLTAHHSNHEQEVKLIRRQNTSALLALQQEYDNEHRKVRTLGRQLEEEAANYEEKMTQIRLQYEDKIKGLMPSSVHQELEDTITSLKMQVTALQQRVNLLQQDDIGESNSYPKSSFLSLHAYPDSNYKTVPMP